jgi:hypothetical protein
MNWHPIIDVILYMIEFRFYLGGGAGSDHILAHILKGAELTVHGGARLLADGESAVEAVLAVHNVLGGQGDGGHAGGKGGHADLGVDGGVGVPAVVVWGIGGWVAVTAVGGGGGGRRQGYCKYE